jgi:hypothetical protein
MADLRRSFEVWEAIGRLMAEAGLMLLQGEGIIVTGGMKISLCFSSSTFLGISGLYLARIPAAED